MANIELVVKFGDSETLIYQKGKGIVCREPSKVAFSKKGKRVFLEEIGQKAKDLIGKTDGSIWIESPFSNSAIEDLDLAQLYFTKLIENYVDKKLGNKMFVVFLLNCALTAEEKRQYEILAINCGIRKYTFAPCLIADLLGADVDINDINGKMVVNIGADSTELALVSNGSIVSGYSIELGGNVLDKEISNYLYREYNVIVNEVTAEQIKKELGSLYPSDISSVNFVGYDALTRASKNNTILAKELYNIFSVFYDKICEGILIFLNQLTPEFVNDVTISGILLTGGNSKVTGIEGYMKSRLNIKVYTPYDVYLNYTIASKKLLEDKNQLKKIVNKN